MALVTAEGVHVTLGREPNTVSVLRGVDLSLSEGSSTGIVGPSGSGKSTLLMVLAGLERADAGRIVVGGHDLTAMSEDALTQFRGATIGIVFQSFHLIPTMTAIENVAVPLELAGLETAREMAAAALEQVGLADRLKHYPTQLSGGEQQRVAIARALVNEPALLLADEPTGNLDETTGHEIIDLLFSAQAARGATLVLITHDRALAARCDRTLHMRDGRCVEPHLEAAQ